MLCWYFNTVDFLSQDVETPRLTESIDSHKGCEIMSFGDELKLKQQPRSSVATRFEGKSYIIGLNS
jgi:hypothetical protein